MWPSNIFVSACASWLPPAVEVGHAVAQGWLSAPAARRLGLQSITVADLHSPPQMASLAAAAAIARQPRPHEHADLLLHATMYYQGQDFWPVASYVQREALGYGCPSVEIRQMSNGGMAALDLAAHYLAADADLHTALLTAAERYSPPGFDRWMSDPGTVYADGAAALVLSSRDGFARVLSLATTSDPSLEAMHRGADAFGTMPFSVRSTVDLEAAKRAFLAEIGVTESVDRVSAGQRKAVEAALRGAQCGFGEIDWFVLPNLGVQRLHNTYFKPFGIPAEFTTLDWLRRVGHLGPGDQFGGLAWLVEHRRLRPGQRCMVLGVGAGFTWSACVIEMLSIPDWGLATFT